MKLSDRLKRIESKFQPNNNESWVTIILPPELCNPRESVTYKSLVPLKKNYSIVVGADLYGEGD